MHPAVCVSIAGRLKLELDPKTQKLVIDITKEAEPGAKDNPPEEPLGMLPNGYQARRIFTRDEEKKRKSTPPCLWERKWHFFLDHYRVWTAFSVGGIPGNSMIFNGTKFSNFVRSNFDLGGESVNVAQGYNGGFAGLPATDIEPFNANALPVTGSWSFTLDRLTGANTFTTPIGSFSIPVTNAYAPLPFKWVGTANFRNFSINIRLWTSAAMGGANPVVTFDSSPNWVHYTNQVFGVKRDGDVFTFTDYNVIKGDAQTLEPLHGTFTPPIPSPCSSADIQAEQVRQSFEDQLNERYFLKDIGGFTLFT